MKNRLCRDSLLIIGGLSLALLIVHYIVIIVIHQGSVKTLLAWLGTIVPFESKTLTWSYFFGSCLVTVFSMAFVWLIVKNLASNPGAKNNVRRVIGSFTGKANRTKPGFLLLFAVAIGMTLLTDVRHDYKDFLLQWAAIMEGADPWDYGEVKSVNAYGPLYNALALLYAVHPLAPKIFFCSVWLIIALYIFKRLEEKYEGEPGVLLAGMIALFFNPFFWNRTVEYGLFDILPATFCLAALVFRLEGEFYLAGIALGMGVLFKYYPLAMLPFLMIDKKRLRISLALSCLGTVGLGLWISVSIWGMSTFTPVLFATERPSKSLSIFRFLRGEVSPLHLIIENPNLDAYSLPAIAVFVTVIFIFIWIRRIEPALAVILGFLTTLTFYRVGHLQFYTTLFLMIPFWYATSTLPESRKQKILFPMGLLLVWLMTMQVTSNLFDGFRPYPWVHFRDIIGLPTFYLECWCIVSAVRYGFLRTEEKPLCGVNG